MSAIEQFRVAVPDAVLDDLAARLRRTRRPPAQSGADDPPFETDEVLGRIDALIEYWRDGYDWRAHEARINRVPQYRTTVDGVGIHFVHVPGQGPDPLPLLLSNGWPSSMLEYLGVIDRLTDPGAHGGDPADAFSVVVPAIPGYGFSDRALDRLPTRLWVAGLFDRLMTERLGYRRYVAHGDDIGGGVINRLGLIGPPGLAAIQTANPIDPYVAPGEALSPEEQSYVAGAERWDRDHGAYAHVQATRPRTLAAALHDSPAGLATWILEKWFAWSDPATRSGLDDDLLIGTVMLYWVTETVASASRYYLASTAAPLKPGERIEVPTAVLFPHEPNLPVPPPSWVRRAYAHTYRTKTLDRGGHFLAAEDPAGFVAAIREAFRPIRQPG
jgi:hypothetical protein